MDTISANRETTTDNIPLTVRNMEAQAQKQPRHQCPCRKIYHKLDWSDSEDEKYNQARSNPIPPTQDIDPQPGTSYASTSTSLRCPSTYPKVLNLGRGRGNFPLVNWTSLAKGCRCGFTGRCDTPQISPVQQEPERNLAVVAPTDRIQTYEGDPASARASNPLANWTWVRLGNNPDRPIVNEIMREQRQGQRPNSHNNRASDDTENAEGDVIYSDEDGSTPSRPGLEDLQ